MAVPVTYVDTLRLVSVRVVRGSISCDPTQPNPIQLTMELAVW